MSDVLQFEPIFPSHAIERCGVTITFSEMLPSKAFQRAVEQSQNRFRSAGLEAIGGGQGRASIGFQIDIASGQTTPLSPGLATSAFATPDKATQFIIAPNYLAVRTNSYVRWRPFAGQIGEFILPLIGTYADTVSVSSVQLDYTDRFLWTGDWGTFDWRMLLKGDGRFVAARASEGHRLWHTHSGWFDETSEVRRLVNVNVDLSDFIQSDRTVPSIAILSLMRDDIPSGGTRYDDAASIQTCLDQLHTGLKALLGEIVTEPMAERISLSAQDPDAGLN